MACEIRKRKENDFYFCITAYARFAIYEFVSCELLDTLHWEIKDSSHIVLSPCLVFGSVVERVGLSHFIAKQFYCKCSPCLTPWSAMRRKPSQAHWLGPLSASAARYTVG